MDHRPAPRPDSEPKAILERLSSSWLTRAAVRNTQYVEDPEPAFDPQLYDFPPALLPFRAHPAYLMLDEPVQRRVQALAWISWNRRVVDTEEMVVCKALAALLNGQTDLSLKGPARVTIRQTLLDEYFHSHIHEVAARITARERQLAPALIDRLSRPGYSHRSYRATAARMTESWEKDVALLTWAVVGELSIYEFLTLVSDDPMIQPGSRALLRLHERDEAAHATVVAHALGEHFHELGEPQRACFVRCLPLAMHSLSQQDWSVWCDVLELAGVANARDIVADVEHDRGVPDQLPLLRGYQRVTSFCEDVGIELPAAALEPEAARYVR
jgi:hypothetical protein